MDENMQTGGQVSDMQREEPQIDPARKALVSQLTANVKNGKRHFDGVFKQMRADMDFTSGKQWPGQTNAADPMFYVANITQRHVQQRVAQLYAKNPRFYYRRRKTLDHTVWDGKMSTLQDALMQVQTAAQAFGGDMNLAAMVVPDAALILQDAQQAMQKRQMVDRIGKTLETLMDYELSQQIPPFKIQMKQLVRRTIECKVGYVKLGFERVTQRRPEDADKITDATEQIARLQSLSADRADNEIKEDDAKLAELQLMLQQLQAQPEMVVREGLVFDFPPSNTIIVDPRCRQLRGFVGAQWVAQEFVLSVDDVKEIYGVDLKQGGYMPYRDPRTPDVNGLGTGWAAFKDGWGRDPSQCVVWEVYSKRDGMVYTIADGYCDFLKAPAAPDVKLDRFWPFFVLAFNEIENDQDIFPQSDVELIRPMAREHNRAREGLREHRIANRPATAVTQGALSDDDKLKLQEHPANAVIEFQGLAPNQKIGDVLQVIQKPAIDPALYEVNTAYDDIMKVTGVQEANLGGTSGATATESSIAEGSRVTSVGSNVDDLDDLLNEMARAASQVLLGNVSRETAVKVCGPGAVWPELSAQEIADELYLEVEAGSSGRPNKAAEIQNIERLAPTLLQLPGLSPEWLMKQVLLRLDDKLDLTDAFADGMPSIQALNAMSKAAAPPAQGGAGSESMQGDQGTANQAQPAGQGAPMAQGAVSPGPGSGMEQASSGYVNGG